MGKFLLIFGFLALTIYVGGFFASVQIQEKLIYPVSRHAHQDCRDKFGTEVIVRDGTYLYHEKKESTDIIVVFYHGNGDTVCDMEFVKDIFDEGDVSYIFPEYVGYSGDGSKASHEGVLKTVEETVKYIEEQNYKNVYVIGQSIGSGAASYHVTLQEPRRLLLLSPFTTLTNVVDDMFPFYPRFLIERFFKDQFNNEERLKDYNNELIVVHGTSDPVVRFSQGEELFESIPATLKEFVAADGYGHADLRESQEMHDAVRNIIQ